MLGHFYWIMVKGQFHMSGVRIQIFKKRLHMKLYPVLLCGQVKVHRNMTTMYSRGVPKVSIYFFTVNNRHEVIFFNLLYQTWRV